MGRFVNPDNSAFLAALDAEIYVDKTGLIKEVNKVLGTTDGYICSSRPRRFGKSTTANMLAAYYSKGCDSKKIFSGLDISKEADYLKHLNKYDVIHIDVQWFLSNVNNTDEIVSYMTESILEEIRYIYPKYISEDIKTVPDALSRIKDQTGRKFIVIIDEWDVLMRDETSDKKAQEDYISFLRGMFKGTEPTKYIQLAYLTGILPIKREKTQSALNNFNEYTMLDSGRLAPYVGFTEDEVKNLCSRYDVDFLETARWYDGYLLGREHVYNPRAVVSVMQRRQFRSFWSQTSTFESIRPFINMDFDNLKSSIVEMLAGNSTDVDTLTFQNDISDLKTRDDVLTLLIHLGYLSYDSAKSQAFIPNEEIRREFRYAIDDKNWSEFLKLGIESKELIDATLEMESVYVASKIEKIHDDYASAISYNNENSLSGVIAIAYLGLMDYYFKPVRELPTGRGFADFIYLPKPEYKGTYPALIIELKWNRNAETAIQQIKEKKYPNTVLSYTGDILLVGINYDKKTKKHECMIEQYKK